MPNQHIIALLEEKPVGQLSADEMAAIESHVATCGDCLRAYRAARISATLIAARAAEGHTASPFFKTRVMAAIRDRRLSPEPAAWLRIWRAAGAMVLAMTTLVVVLIGLTVFNYPLAAPPAPEAVASQNSYSPDALVFGQDEAADETYDQVLGTIYDSEDGDEN
jgi:anti-sigma factor RsiW